MEPSVKDKHIILGFVGFAILLISSIATLVVAEKFNQDTFVRMIVFVCSNLLGWLLYFSFQTVIFDTYEIYRIKFGRKKTPAEITEIQEDQSQDAHKPVISASMPTGGARQKIFCEMNQKAQAILGGLTSIFGKYHGKFWRDTPPEAPRRELCGVAFSDGTAAGRRRPWRCRICCRCR